MCFEWIRLRMSLFYKKIQNDLEIIDSELKEISYRAMETSIIIKEALAAIATTRATLTVLRPSIENVDKPFGAVIVKGKDSSD
jgi:hypothetical protein